MTQGTAEPVALGCQTQITAQYWVRDKQLMCIVYNVRRRILPSKPQRSDHNSYGPHDHRPRPAIHLWPRAARLEREPLRISSILQSPAQTHPRRLIVSRTIAGPRPRPRHRRDGRAQIETDHLARRGRFGRHAPKR